MQRGRRRCACPAASRADPLACQVSPKGCSGCEGSQRPRPAMAQGPSWLVRACAGAGPWLSACPATCRACLPCCKPQDAAAACALPAPVQAQRAPGVGGLGAAEQPQAPTACSLPHRSVLHAAAVGRGGSCAVSARRGGPDSGFTFTALPALSPTESDSTPAGTPLESPAKEGRAQAYIPQEGQEARALAWIPCDPALCPAYEAWPRPHASEPGTGSVKALLQPGHCYSHSAPLRTGLGASQARGPSSQAHASGQDHPQHVLPCRGAGTLKHLRRLGPFALSAHAHAACRQLLQQSCSRIRWCPAWDPSRPWT